MLLCAVEVFGGGTERAEAPEVVGDVEVETRVEAGHPETCVVSLCTFVGERVSGIKRPNVPDEGLGGAFVEVGQVVSERAPVKWVAGRAYLEPDVEEVPAGGAGVALAATENGRADGVHRRIGCGVSRVGQGVVPSLVFVGLEYGGVSVVSGFALVRRVGKAPAGHHERGEVAVVG